MSGSPPAGELDADSSPPGGRWLTPGVAGIGSASLLADAGHEIPTALLPSLLTSTLGAPAAALGAIEGVSDGLAGLARLGGGALADDPQRRQRVAVGGYTTTAVLSAATAGATASWQVAVLRAGAGTARGLRVPARNALLADVVPASAYGRAYGFERAMDNLGAIIGPLLAIGLVAAVGTRWAIALSVIPGMLAAIAIVYAIRHTPRPAKTEHQPIRIKIRPMLRGPLGRLMVGISIFEIGNCAATLLILRATDLLSPGRDTDTATQLAIGLYVTYNIAATLVSLPAGQLGDRTKAPRTLVYGVAAFALAYSFFAIGPETVLGLAPGFIAAGIGIGIVETAEHAAVATLVIVWAARGLHGERHQPAPRGDAPRRYACTFGDSPGLRRARPEPSIGHARERKHAGSLRPPTGTLRRARPGDGTGALRAVGSVRARHPPRRRGRGDRERGGRTHPPHQAGSAARLTRPARGLAYRLDLSAAADRRQHGWIVETGAGHDPHLAPLQLLAAVVAGEDRCRPLAAAGVDHSDRLVTLADDPLVTPLPERDEHGPQRFALLG
ncbi:MAG TPA: MFS transporter [Acidimicrobiales bacterium]|nr:MFS transporter [Acidimicrobiales bacterium]